MGLLDSTSQKKYHQGGDHGNYQFTSLDNVITQFQIAYVGEDKIISKIKRVDIAFHAQRALQELSFDTFKSTKAQEITVPSSLKMTLPQDYVNYTKISWVDSAGIKHLLYPTSKTSNPPKINQNADGTYYSNLVLNPNFQNGTTNTYRVGYKVMGLGWYNNFYSNTELYYTTSSNGIFISSNGVGGALYPHLGQRIPLVDGQTYKLSWNVVSIGAATANGTKIFLYGGHEGVNSYRPVNVQITTLGDQAPIEFTYDASQNNGKDSLNLAIEMQDGGNHVKTVGLKDFLLVKINEDGNFGMADNGEFVDANDSTTWSNYKSGTPSENQNQYDDDTYWPMDGSRYGLDPQHAQANGSFYIDDISGKIHFSSNISGKTVVLDYISDSLGTDGEMQVHKFAEEAMYKCIAYGILSTRANTQEYLVQRFKKERFAAIRTAKLRLSNIKLEEITQILRGKSKQIKH